MRLDYAEDFDEEVNKALADGWALEKREIIVPRTAEKHLMLYAELVKPDPPKVQPEPDLMAAVRMINKLCLQFGACRHCPLDDICEHRPPNLWDPPDEEVQP